MSRTLKIKGDVLASSLHTIKYINKSNASYPYNSGMSANVHWRCVLSCLWFASVDPHYIERSGLYIGQGKTMMSRAGIFRALQGIAVDMNDRVYRLPSFNGITHLYF